MAELFFQCKHSSLLIKAVEVANNFRHYDNTFNNFTYNDNTYNCFTYNDNTYILQTGDILIK